MVWAAKTAANRIAKATAARGKVNEGMEEGECRDDQTDPQPETGAMAE